MKLSWMGDYREVVEALIRYCNVYAYVYKSEKLFHEGVNYSYAQIQVIEYLLENEEKQEPMTAIAARLGVTRSNFTKIINRLEQKGLVEKNYIKGSRKSIAVTVNDKGRKLYDTYSKEILRWHFAAMFNELKEIPPEYRDNISKALTRALEAGANYKP
jgi:DNA-binding MarR family transcriptional regulator